MKGLVVVLIVVGLVVVHGKSASNPARGKKRTNYPVRTFRVRYNGDWKNCDDYHTIDSSGNGCNCPFIACTGTQQCSGGGGFHCRFMRKNVDVTDMTRADCACKWYKKDSN